MPGALPRVSGALIGMLFEKILIFFLLRDCFFEKMS